MEYPMDSSDIYPEGLPDSEGRNGLLMGWWYVPVEGYRWAADYRRLDGTRGFVDEEWERGPWLLPVGDLQTGYELMRRRGLLKAVDRLASDVTLDTILSFANRWGGLGQRDPLVRAPDGVPARGPIERGEPVRAWSKALGHFGPLRELWARLRLVIHPERHGVDDVRAARDWLGERIAWTSDGACTFTSGHGMKDYRAAILHPADSDFEFLRERLAGRDLEAARYHVHREINRQLRGTVSPAVLPFMGSVIRFFPSTLLSAIWLRFAQEVAGGAGRQRACDECHLPFLQGRRDQRFCSKSCQERSAYARRTRPSADAHVNGAAKRDPS